MNLIKRLIAALIPAKRDAKPVKFPEANFIYTRPATMSEQQCGDLPCFRAETNTVSCWQFPLRDRLTFLFTGRIWLYLVMGGHPPVALMADSPFPKPEKKEKSGNVLWQIVIGAIVGGFVSMLVVWFLTR